MICVHLEWWACIHAFYVGFCELLSFNKVQDCIDQAS